MSEDATYAGPLIDAHHHLWVLGKGDYPWLEEPQGTLTALGDLAPIRASYLPGDHAADLGATNLVGAVHVEAFRHDPDAEIVWLDELERSGGPDRYIAAADLEAAGFGEKAARLADHPRVAGVRATLSWHPDARLSFVDDPRRAERPGWRAGVETLARNGLLLELMIYPYQAEQVRRLAEDIPQLFIVINHCGSPVDRDQSGLDRWRAALGCLADAPNIVLKASNPGVYVGPGDEAAIVATIRECISSFGIERVLFGSDLPVSKLHVAARDIVRMAALATADRPPADRHAFFYMNAESIYRMNGGKPHG